MPRSIINNIGATLFGLSLIVVTARSAEGQTIGKLQVTARVLDLSLQQEALTQAWMAVSRLPEGKQVLEGRPRPGEGLILLTVSRFDSLAGRHPPEAFAVASLVYIAN